MKKMFYFTICMSLLICSSCDVHEWPDTPEFAKLHLRLNYETEMTEWEHLYDGTSIIEQRLGETYDNHQEYGEIRYIVRAYPISEERRTMQNHTQEFVFTKNISEGYDHEVTLDILPGNYNVMVWSDLIPSSAGTHFYDTGNFSEVMPQGEHQANTDHRDAFRGTSSISLVMDVTERLPDTLDIVMQRPLAKYEIITTDVEAFIEKETSRIASKANADKTEPNEDIPTRAANIEDYKVVFYHVGFMPNTYSIETDKPVDSATGVFFESTLKKTTESEATMGFDYTFVNGKKSTVTLQIGIYDNEGTQLSMTEPIEIPLKRSHHTLLKGMFLMSEASGGVTINPDYEGDHNLIFP